MNISAFILGYLAVDFICTMLNRYVFKKSPQLERSHEKESQE